MKEWMNRKIEWANSRSWGEILLFVIVFGLVGLLLWGGVEWIKSDGAPLDVASAGRRRQAQVQPQPQPPLENQNVLIPNEYYVKDSNTAFHTGELQNDEEKRFVWHQLGLAGLTVERNAEGQIKLTQEIEELLLAIRQVRVEKELNQPRYQFDYLLRSGDVAKPSDWEKTRMISNHELKLIREFMEEDCPNILGAGPVYHLTWKASRALLAYRKANPVNEVQEEDPPTRVLPIAGSSDTEVVTRVQRHGRRDRRGRADQARVTNRNRRLRANRNSQVDENQGEKADRPAHFRLRTNFDHTAEARTERTATGRVDSLTVHSN